MRVLNGLQHQAITKRKPPLGDFKGGVPIILTFNLLYKYIVKKNIIYLKVKIFLFFSEALSMWNQITNKNADNSVT